MAPRGGRPCRPPGLPGPSRRPPRKRRNGGPRARADRQLAQGTGRTVARPFQAARKAVSLRGWDAFDYCHAPLPRATGPYTVVRTTNLVASSAKFSMVGAFKDLSKNLWTNVCLIEDVVAGTSISAAGNALARSVPFPGGAALLGSGLTAVPAAISVQVMNPEALQATTGICALGVCSTQLDVNNRLESWNELATEFISFFRPRLCSAAKLSLRGIQMNSYPMDMSSVSDFRPLFPIGDQTTFTLDNGVAGSGLAPDGWAPIVIVNENGVALQLLVTIEWRVRFDIGNPAVASHVHHGVTSDVDWNKMLTNAIALGNGAVDIASKVASAGQAAAPLMAMLK